ILEPRPIDNSLSVADSNLFEETDILARPVNVNPIRIASICFVRLLRFAAEKASEYCEATHHDHLKSPHLNSQLQCLIILEQRQTLILNFRAKVFWFQNQGVLAK